MEVKRLTYFGVLELPNELLPDSLYYVKPEGSTYVDYVITDSEGNPFDVISNDRIESLLIPYNVGSSPQNGQILIFDGNEFIPQDLPSVSVPNEVLTHITRTDNPHNVQESQIPPGIDYTLLFENALI